MNENKKPNPDQQPKKPQQGGQDLDKDRAGQGNQQGGNQQPGKDRMRQPGQGQGQNQGGKGDVDKNIDQDFDKDKDVDEDERITQRNPAPRE